MTAAANNLITDVPGIAVGHAIDEQVRTGATVILPEQRCIAACDVRGGGPGTRETDSCAPESLNAGADAIVLSGGSSFGLEAASAAAKWLGARKRGFRFAHLDVVSPVVPSAILFDLANGGDKNWGASPPYAHLGEAACNNAGTGRFALGNAGAGYGAAAGQLKGGLGSASAALPGGLIVGALVAVNAFGSPVMPGSDCFWAWPFERNGEFGDRRPPPQYRLPEDTAAGTKADGAGPGSNTSLGVVACNAALTPAQAKRIAIMAHDGLARALRPVHTPMDGDTIFVLPVGGIDLEEPAYAQIAAIGAAAADCVARAVARGVYEAETLGPMRGYRDIYGV